MNEFKILKPRTGRMHPCKAELQIEFMTIILREYVIVWLSQTITYSVSKRQLAPIANCELRIANCELRIANCELRILARWLYVCQGILRKSFVFYSKFRRVIAYINYNNYYFSKINLYRLFL